jgi:hypothetical protein
MAAHSSRTERLRFGINEVLRKPLHRRDLAESLARAFGSLH